MYEELFSRTTEQMEQFMTPARKMQDAFVEHMARLTELQVNSMKDYSDLGINQMRALLEIRNAEDMQSYMARNTDLIKTLNEKLSSDMTALSSLQRSLAEALQTLGQDALNTSMEEAGKAQKQASTATRKSA